MGRADRTSKPRRPSAFGGAAVAAEAAALKLQSGRLAGRVVVRCCAGHLFTTIWIPGVSIKSARLARPVVPGGSASDARAAGSRGAADGERGVTVDQEKRRQIAYEMQQIVYDNFLYTQLVNQDYVDAHAKTWMNFKTLLEGYSKEYYTAPYRVS